jgi:zinc protease
MREKLFEHHPYALRTSGRGNPWKAFPGRSKSIQEQFIVAENGVLAVFGDIKAEEVLRLVEKYFGTMPAGKLALAVRRNRGAAAPLNVVEERNKQQAVVMIGYPGSDVLSPDRTLLDLLNEASNDLGSRFFNRIREQMGLAYFVGAGNFAGLVPGSFVFYLGTDPKKVDAVTAELQDEINGLSRDGLTEEELARAKKKLLGSEAIRNQSNSAFAANVAVDELVGLGFDNYLRRKKEVESATVGDVRSAAGISQLLPRRGHCATAEKTAANQTPHPQS